MTALEARDLAIGYGATEIARGLDLSVIAGSVTCLLGPNGVGKTTLFKTLLGLIPPLSGTVAINDSDLSRLDRQAIARQIAYVPQAQIAEFPYTVIDLVVMGRTAHLGTFGGPRRADHEAAMAALDKLGIASLAERDFDTDIGRAKTACIDCPRACPADAHRRDGRADREPRPWQSHSRSRYDPRTSCERPCHRPFDPRTGPCFCGCR